MNDIQTTTPGYFTEADCDLAEFIALTSRRLSTAQVPHATAIEKNIPVYDAAALAQVFARTGSRRALMAEWAAVLMHHAGILVLKRACPDLEAIDAATAAYMEIIACEKAEKGEGADHFAAAGSNDRIWNSLQKFCEAAPEVFARYFACPAIDAVCEAWLGPNYQMTAQANLVHPGGQAQQAHRDYHLGFQTDEVSVTYPAHVHGLSPVLTLQGAIAHCDMPVESGPTKLLPFSQAYRPGYLAWRREDFRAHFEAHNVQLPLEKGDAVFFNPAVFHAAGANRSADIERFANLLQISSAFGRAMETVDRDAMCRALYPALQTLLAQGRLSPAELSATVSACAEGYAFPTNLDRDPPVGGLAPKTQKTLMMESLEARWTPADFEAALAEQSARRLA